MTGRRATAIVNSNRTVRHFRVGARQVVRIPHGFELPGTEALLRQEENGRLALERLPRRDLMELLATLEPLKEEDQLPAIDDLPAN